MSREGTRKVMILLAEDVPVNQKLILRIVEKMGYKCSAVNNGLEAVGALELEEYDLVLMDVQMPEMDGLEATKIIKQKKFDIPIIAVTAQAFPGDREKCLEAGMDDYVAKPVRQEKLKEVIEKHLSKDGEGENGRKIKKETY